jgi:hypothetical protein
MNPSRRVPYTSAAAAAAGGASSPCTDVLDADDEPACSSSAADVDRDTAAVRPPAVEPRQSHLKERVRTALVNLTEALVDVDVLCDELTLRHQTISHLTQQVDLLRDRLGLPTVADALAAMDAAAAARSAGDGDEDTTTKRKKRKGGGTRT